MVFLEGTSLPAWRSIQGALGAFGAMGWVRLGCETRLEGWRVEFLPGEMGDGG